MRRPLPSALVPLALVAAAVVAYAQGRSSVDIEGLFARFFQARSAEEVRQASGQILASGITFDEAFGRLKRGREYSASAARGIVQASYRNDAAEYFYMLDVPQSYAPTRRYQLRVQLHGGVGRLERSTPPSAEPAGRLAGAEQIYLFPYAWRDAPWWSRRQADNLRTILDLVKRAYNVDENRVVLAGVSDGGTGAYFEAMRDTTPFACFLPLNGFLPVLRNELATSDGDLFPNNLRNKPLFVVNGGRDPLYPTSLVEPYIEHLKAGGVDVAYHPQPGAGHNTSWWPEVRDSFEQFVADHPRQPLPDVLTWETNEVPSRAHWLEINSLAGPRPGDAVLPNLNTRASKPVLDFGVRGSGPRINRVVADSNAQRLGLESGDVVTALNGQPVDAGTDIGEALRAFPQGRPLVLTVARQGNPVRLTGRYAPSVLAGDAEMIFPPGRPSGRVDLARTANTVEARTQGVGAFTLLLSPDQFDFGHPLTVVLNGRTVVERVVQKDLRTLLEWAALDNDRTMLFAAAIRVDVP